MSGEKIHFFGNDGSFEPWTYGIFKVTVNVTDLAGNSAERIRWTEVEQPVKEKIDKETNWPFILMLSMTLLFGAGLLLFTFKDRILPPDTGDK